MTSSDTSNLPDEKFGRQSSLDTFLLYTRDRILLDLSVSLSFLPPAVHHDSLIPGYLRNRLKLIFDKNPLLLPDLFSLLEVCRDVLNNPVPQNLVLTDTQVIHDLLSRSGMLISLLPPSQVPQSPIQDPDDSEIVQSLNRIETILLSGILFSDSPTAQHQLNYLKTRGILY